MSGDARMNAVLDGIRQRRSVRAYRPEQLSEETLQAILSAGRAAPSGGDSRTTHLLVIQNTEVLGKLRALVEGEFAKMEDAETLYKSIRNSIAASKRGGYEFFFRAPTLVVAANRTGYGNAMADSACVLENMMIAATALGVGSCWINQLHWLDENAAVRAYLHALGLAENETVCGGLALGYPKSENAFRALEKEGNPVTYIR